MKKHFSKLLLILGFIAISSSVFATTLSWDCGGKLYKLEFNSDKLTLDEMIEIADQVREQVC